MTQAYKKIIHKRAKSRSVMSAVVGTRTQAVNQTTVMQNTAEILEDKLCKINFFWYLKY